MLLFYLGSRKTCKPWFLEVYPIFMVPKVCISIVDFDPEVDVPFVISSSLFGDDVLRRIRDSLWKYIDKSEPKLAMYVCPKIRVKLDLEKGLPKAICLTLDGWSHIQKINYGLLLFNCRICHDYDHFVKKCKKKLSSRKPITRLNMEKS